MASGDVVSDVQSISAAANLDFQPASGVQVMIMCWTHAGNSTDVNMYNGTVQGIILSGYATGVAVVPLKFPINNTVYLRLSNGTGGAQILGYSGIDIS